MTLEAPILAAIGIFLAYALLVGIVWRATGTRYDALVDSREHVIRGVIVPIGLGAVLLALATTWLGWWNAALFEGSRSGPGWVLLVPLIFGLVAVLNIASIDFRSPKARLLPLILVGTLLVGFSEELLTRGILVVGLREGGAGEWLVWLVTSAMFALLHGMNALFGQSPRATAVQIIAAFAAGTALYVTLTSTGTLLVGMLLHALWDFGALGVLATDSKQKPLAGVLSLATYVIALASVWFVVTWG